MYKRKTYNEVQHTNDSDSDDSVEEPNWREHYEQESEEENSDSEEEVEEVAEDDEEQEEEKEVSKSSKLGPKKEFAAKEKSALPQKENVRADEEDEEGEEDEEDEEDEEGGSKRTPYFEALRCLACPKILLINAASLENHVNSKRHKIASKKFAKREEEPEEDLDLIRPAHEVDALGRHG
eukprot:gene31663-39890_t